MVLVSDLPVAENIAYHWLLWVTESVWEAVSELKYL